MRNRLFPILNPAASLFDKLVLMRLVLLTFAVLAGLNSESGLLVWSTIAGYALTHAVLFWFRRPGQTILMTSLWVDLLAITIMLQLNNGVLSGWVTLLLLPALIGGLALTTHMAWLISLMSIAAYVGLMQHYLQQTSGMEEHVHHAHTSMSAHLMGMLITFAVSVLLLTAFLTYQARLLRKQQSQLDQLHDRKWREQHIVALATLSANTTHQLATPLASAMMLMEDVLETGSEACAVDSDLREDISQAYAQLGICKHALQHLVQQAREFNPDLATPLPAKAWLKGLGDRWWATHNEIAFDSEMHLLADDAVVQVNDNLTFALTNLLDNAAKACRDVQNPYIKLRARVEDDTVIVDIEDNGEGLDSELASELGKGFVSSESGMGIGVTLAQSAIEQAGGQLSMRQLEHGVCTRVGIPVFIREPAA